MGFMLKEVLKTLCGANQWCYAVFWKIGCQNPNLLIWEESHYEPMLCSTLINRMVMDNQVYVLGEGIVGRSAFTGDHQWIHSSNYIRHAHPPEVSNEVHNQFSAGMQTVAVVPVLPHGVVQLGSPFAIPENLGFLNEVKSLILQLGCVQGALLFDHYPAKVSTNEIATPVIFEMPVSVNSSGIYEAINSTPSMLGSCNQQSNVSRASRPVGQSSYPLMQQAQNNILTTNSTMQTSSLAQSVDISAMKRGQLQNGVLGTNVISSNLDAWSSQQNSSLHNNPKRIENNFSEVCAQPSSGDDLFDMLGLNYKNKILNNSVNELDAIPQNMFMETSSFMNIHNAGSDSGLFSEMGSDHLLDAVVSKAQSFTKQSSDDNVSCNTTVTKISSSSVPNTSPTYGRGIGPDQAFGIRNSVLKPGYGKDDDQGSCSQTSSIYGSQISSWVEQGHNVKHDTSVSTAFSKKTGDTCKPNRKRLKPGENPRPRPKDRQMIQDRVKELREIVPNGAKCSIDALLERTIKHMLFLQGVTKHADELKQTTGEFKIASKEGGLLLKDNFDGGATWAFEVGSKSMLCPIIVEDLDSPRQMLVEMLCEERGVFLEIADLVRGLGLTILKGVMEARDDKIWARFAVEADRDVTRMEIFMSLVRLLEQTGKGSTSSANSMDNNNMIIHNSYPQAPSIPATGHMH